MPVGRAADGGDALFLALRIYNFKPAKVEWQSALLALHTHSSWTLQVSEMSEMEHFLQYN